MKIALPLPDGFVGAKLKFKATTPLPKALHLSGGKLTGTARQTGVFTFSVQITKAVRVKSKTTLTTVIVTYRLTVILN